MAIILIVLRLAGTVGILVAIVEIVVGIIRGLTKHSWNILVRGFVV